METTDGIIQRRDVLKVLRRKTCSLIDYGPLADFRVIHSAVVIIHYHHVIIVYAVTTAGCHGHQLMCDNRSFHQLIVPTHDEKKLAELHKILEKP